MESPTLKDFIETRLLKSRYTSFTDDGETQCIVTEDGLARCSTSHTLIQSNGAMAFRNFIQECNHADGRIDHALVEFYRNSLTAGEPMTANMIICNEGLVVPHPFLRRIHWGHKAWFIFNEKTGLLTDKWWHIYGCFPD